MVRDRKKVEKGIALDILKLLSFEFGAVDAAGVGIYGVAVEGIS